MLSLANLAVTISEFGTLRTQFRDQDSPLSTVHTDEVINLMLGAVVFFGLVEVLLWAWMAWKIKTGRHWARVLSTVFFGITVAGQLVGNTSMFSNLSQQEQSSSGNVPHPLIAVILGWATVAVGLNAVALFWQKSNAPFFRPRQFANPGGYPYAYPYPPQGYPTAPYAQVPGQAAPVPPEGQPQPPADPWSTPPQQ